MIKLHTHEVLRYLILHTSHMLSRVEPQCLALGTNTAQLRFFPNGSEGSSGLARIVQKKSSKTAANISELQGVLILKRSFFLKLCSFNTPWPDVYT